MISLTNYDFQWGRSELVIIFPGVMEQHGSSSSKICRYSRGNEISDVSVPFKTAVDG